jgi:dolichol-phosphate mannosyltransferase
MTKPLPAAVPTVSVVVPVYDNEGSLAPLFEELRSVEEGLRERELRLELIFVDDGSRDRSFEALRTIKQVRPETKVVKLTRNFGAVHASKTGFRFVTGDCFLILAADLQDPPQLILEAVDRWRQGARFVICVRERREDSPLTKAFAWLHYRLVRWLVVSDYPRGGFDVALMSRQLLPHMIDSARHANTPLFAYWLGFEPEVITYVRRRRRHGKSKWSFRKRAGFFVDTLVGFSVVPLRAMSLFGGLVSLASFSYGSVIAINALRGLKGAPGFATLTVSLSFLIGLVIVMLGVIGEYLWRIYDEVSRKPESVIEVVL